MLGCGALTLAGGDSAYRRSLYRRFLALLVGIFSESVPPTRRCVSAFPLGGFMIVSIIPSSGWKGGKGHVQTTTEGSVCRDR
jgi:hypothetical protein